MHLGGFYIIFIMSTKSRRLPSALWRPALRAYALSESAFISTGSTAAIRTLNWTYARSDCWPKNTRCQVGVPRFHRPTGCAAVLLAGGANRWIVLGTRWRSPRCWALSQRGSSVRAAHLAAQRSAAHAANPVFEMLINKLPELGKNLMRRQPKQPSSSFGCPVISKLDVFDDVE